MLFLDELSWPQCRAECTLLNLLAFMSGDLCVEDIIGFHIHSWSHSVIAEPQCRDTALQLTSFEQKSSTFSQEDCFVVILDNHANHANEIPTQNSMNYS